MYSSCSGTVDPNLGSSEPSDTLSVSEEDAGGVPGANSA